MTRKSKRKNQESAGASPPPQPLIPVAWLRLAGILIAALALVAGIYFRLDNLDHKTYWFDEVRTLLTLSGQTYTSASGKAFDGKLVRAADLNRIVHPETPVSLTRVTQSILAEGVGSTHPPLFFVLAKVWQSVAGTEPVKLRLLAAIFGILALPPSFLLARELFGSGLGMLVFASLSPFLVLMSQEARNYSLWHLSIVLAALFLLRALRTGEKRDWVLYGLAAACGLYTHFMMALVLGGFTVFVLLDQRLKMTAITKHFAIATGAALAALVPWLVLMFLQLSSSSGYSSTTFELGGYAGTYYLDKLWSNSFRVFWDVMMQVMSLQGLIAWLVFLVEYWSVFFVFRFAPRRGKIFAICLLLIPYVLVMLGDAFTGTILSTVARYLLPSAIALILTISFLVYRRTSDGSLATRATTMAIAGLLVFLEIYSCYSGAQPRSWWTRQVMGHEHVGMSMWLNSQDNPILIATDKQWTTFGELMTLCPLLTPKVRLILTRDDHIPALPHEKLQVYLFEPSGEFISQITAQYHCKCHPIPNAPGFFQLVTD